MTLPTPAAPSIRVVVVNFNRRQLLKACLESLALQSHRSFEVVVIDNGSIDGSADFVEDITKNFPVPEFD